MAYILNCVFRFPVQNVPVDVKFPRQCNKGLWGGEGFIIGYIKKKPRSQRSVSFFIWHFMSPFVVISGCCTGVRLQQVQKQRYPLLPVYVVS